MPHSEAMYRTSASISASSSRNSEWAPQGYLTVAQSKAVHARHYGHALSLTRGCYSLLSPLPRVRRFSIDCRTGYDIEPNVIATAASMMSFISRCCCSASVLLRGAGLEVGLSGSVCVQALPPVKMQSGSVGNGNTNNSATKNRQPIITAAIPLCLNTNMAIPFLLSQLLYDTNSLAT